MEDILIKVHESYRWVVAVCDKEIYGKKLQEGKRVLDLSTNFFKGKEFSLEEAKEEILRCIGEDATFNFVGENSINLAKEIGIAKDEGISKIENIPFALVLL